MRSSALPLAGADVAAVVDLDLTSGVEFAHHSHGSLVLGGHSLEVLDLLLHFGQPGKLLLDVQVSQQRLLLLRLDLRLGPSSLAAGLQHVD